MDTPPVAEECSKDFPERFSLIRSSSLEAIKSVHDVISFNSSKAVKTLSLILNVGVRTSDSFNWPRPSKRCNSLCN